MQIGFIGAGKVGVSLGKYFKEKGLQVGGFYSRSSESAAWAATFTNTIHYKSLEEIISSCDMIFFTVPDDAIASVWEEAKPFVSGKIIAHCSGLHSSKIFSEMASTKSIAYSIHPLCAISNREHSWEKLSDTLFTIEGGNQNGQSDIGQDVDIPGMFKNMGNRICIVSAENKAKYHAAASLASNHMTADFSMAKDLFMECGFIEKSAEEELYKLASGNLNNILLQGCTDSLTGPIERGDCATVEKHLQVLEEDRKCVYLANARQLIKIAQQKNAERDYQKMWKLIEKEQI